MKKELPLSPFIVLSTLAALAPLAPFAFDHAPNEFSFRSHPDQPASLQSAQLVQQRFAETRAPHDFIALKDILLPTRTGAPPGSTNRRTDEIHVYPPLDFRARPQEGGIRLSWLPDSRNPVQGIQYRLLRWRGDQTAEELAILNGIELFDPAECEGVPYQYRLFTQFRRTIGAGFAERDILLESSPARAKAQIPRTGAWEAVGLTQKDEPLLIFRRAGRPDKGPYPVFSGFSLGPDGWIAEGYFLRETKVPRQTIHPRFDALGRRVIIMGRPANRVLEALEPRRAVSVRLTDPCGVPWSLDLLLPKVPIESQSTPMSPSETTH